MAETLRSSRDVILRTDTRDEAIKFYGSVRGLPITHHSETLTGFGTGPFCLYVERGHAHGPVFDFLAADIQVTRQQLPGAGSAVVEEDASVPRCYMRDPYGLVFNLGQAHAAE
ncbi:VOC family protein [Rhodanobacter sp. C05]|uniref:VOC family protein n=1 Tax=Rhodanobacter sp. C05 TaxID=1945855 RepID=UPI00117A4CEB|nr:VOC family protein [Rhodanobacter sp. C05]